MLHGKFRWKALLLVVVAASLGALAERLTNRLADSIESRFGYTPNPAATREFLRELDSPMFSDAGQEVIEKAQQKDTFLYRYADKAHRAVYGTAFGPWRQGIGDCVSFGWGMGSYVGQSVDWAQGKLAEPPRLICTEAIYGGSRCESRGVTFAGWSDGSYGAAAARWVAGLKNGTGGILYRQKYGDLDLNEYSPSRAKEWGAYGCGGRDNKELDKIANQHTARNVALVRTFDEAAAAIESGFCVPVCSGVGFAKTRDADGFAARQGAWAHCQCFIAVRYAKNEGKRDGLLCINSWGPSWISGPKWPADMPDGSYWVSRETVNAMLAGEDSFAIGGVDGFRWRNLDHGGWMEHPPRIEAIVPAQKRNAAGLVADTFKIAL